MGARPPAVPTVRHPAISGYRWSTGTSVRAVRTRLWGYRLATSIPRHLSVACCTAAALAWATAAIISTESVLHSDFSDLGLHLFGVLTIGIGAVVWVRSSTPRIGGLIMLCGVAFY